MSYTIPTIKVRTDSSDNKDGYYLINEEDFDPEVHELFEAVTEKEIPPSIQQKQPEQKKNSGKR